MTAPVFPISSATPFFDHVRTANLDYGWDFTDQIVATDSILSATFELEMKNPGGTPVTDATLTLGEIVNTPATDSDPQSNVVYSWLAIQTPTPLVGKRIAGTCSYVTVQGRTDKRTLYFTIT